LNYTRGSLTRHFFKSQSSPSKHDVLHREIVELTSSSFEEEVLEADQVICHLLLLIIPEHGLKKIRSFILTLWRD